MMLLIVSKINDLKTIFKKLENEYFVSNLARHVPDATKANEIHVIAKMFMSYFLMSRYLYFQNMTCQ